MPDSAAGQDQNSGRFPRSFAWGNGTLCFLTVLVGSGLGGWAEAQNTVTFDLEFSCQNPISVGASQSCLSNNSAGHFAIELSLPTVQTALRAMEVDDLGREDAPYYAADEVRRRMEEDGIGAATLLLDPTEADEDTCFLYLEDGSAIRIIGLNTVEAFDFPSCESMFDPIVAYAVSGSRQEALSGAFRHAGLPSVRFEALASLSGITALAALSSAEDSPEPFLLAWEMGTLPADLYGAQELVPTASFEERTWICASCFEHVSSNPVFDGDEIYQSIYFNVNSGEVSAAFPGLGRLGNFDNGQDKGVFMVSNSDVSEAWSDILTTMRSLEDQEFVLSQYEGASWVLDSHRGDEVVFSSGQIPGEIPAGIVDFYVNRETPVENLPSEFRSVVLWSRFLR